MGRREDQKAATRELLIDAAAEVIAERGYEGTTTRLVAQRAGVAVGTVFAHFRDKDALIGALLHDHVEAALEQAFASLPPDGDLVDRLVYVAATLYEGYDERPDLSRAMLQASLFQADPDSPLADQLRRFEVWVGEEIGRAIASGALGDCSPAVGFLAFFSQYFALLVGGLRGDLPAASRPLLLEQLLRRSFPLRGPSAGSGR